MGYQIIIEPRIISKSYWKDLIQYKDLLLILVWKEVKVRYKQAVLGTAWAIIRPLITSIIFLVVFNKAAGLEITQKNIPYALFIYMGLLPWQFFSNAVGEASNGLIGNNTMINKVFFPRLIIPLSLILMAFIDFLVSGLFASVLFLWFQIIPSIKILFLPLFIFMVLLFSIGLSCYLAAQNVLYRDFKFMVPFILQISLYISPIGFDPTLIETKFGVIYKYLYLLNPLVGIINGFRWCLFSDYPLDKISMLFSFSISLLFFLFGLIHFRKTERIFADKL